MDSFIYLYKDGVTMKLSANDFSSIQHFKDLGYEEVELSVQEEEPTELPVGREEEPHEHAIEPHEQEIEPHEQEEESEPIIEVIEEKKSTPKRTKVKI